MEKNLKYNKFIPADKRSCESMTAIQTYLFQTSYHIATLS